GQFSLADFDSFEVQNFNRQAGATLNTLGRAKLDVMSEMAASINPNVEIRSFRDGVHEDNVEAFLDDADLYIDGLDFFVLDVRRMIFDHCARRGIPAITVAPLGMGAALLAFMPGHMTFEQYFCMNDCSEAEKSARFLV